MQQPVDQLQLDLREQLPEVIQAATVAAFRAEALELTRMIRQQGDAADEVAETLGRTLARLGAEVEALAQAIERLEGAAGVKPA